MKRVLSAFLALLMVLSLVPALLIGVGAEETSAQNEGTGVTASSADSKYSITLEKTEFKKGEPIMVTATGEYADTWVALCPRGAGTYPEYYYLGKSGNGIAYNIIHNKVYAAGEYEIYIVPRKSGSYGNKATKIDITITDEEYTGTEVYPNADFGDTSKLYTKDNQKVFKKGEPIYIYAEDTTPSHGYGDWIANYSDVYDTQYDKYVYARNVCKNGEYYDLTKMYNFAPGTHLIRLLAANAPIPGYENNTVAAIYITILDEEYSEPEEVLPDKTISVNKTEFKEGEPIMVTATGYGSDWVGIAQKGDSVAILWYYVDHFGSYFSPGTGVTYDIRQVVEEGSYYIGGKYQGTDAVNIPAGEYVLYYVENNQNLDKGYLHSIPITVVADSAGGEGGNGGGEDVGGGNQGGEEPPAIAPDFVVNKTVFEVGEEILVTATGTGKDWVGLFQGNNYVNNAWYYIDIANGGWGSGVERNVITNGSVPAGTYTLAIVPNGSSSLGDAYKTIEIKIVENNEMPANPTDAEYIINNAADGMAAGTVTVTLQEWENRAVVMFWANEDGVLTEYTPIRFKAQGGTSTFVFGASTVIPKGATELWIYAQSTVSSNLSSECVKLSLGAGASMGELGQAITSIFVVSDIHITSSMTDVHANNFKKMIYEAIALNPNGTAIFVVGDIADNGYEAQYENMVALYLAALSENGKDATQYPIFLATGNHDHSSGLVYNEVVSLFLQYAKLPNGESPTDTSYDFWLGGYHYIFLGTDANAGLYASLSAETLAWLDQKLSENRDPARPTFVFLHQPIYNTVSGSLPGEGWNGVSNEAGLINVLKNYPEVMLFNGHTHWTMDSVGNIFEGTEELPIHAFNCASVAYLWSGFDKLTGDHLDGSQGYYIEIYDGKVFVRGRDFANSKWISAAQYVIDMHEHSYETTGIAYANGYMQNGTRTDTCTNCGHESVSKVDALFVYSGYSVSTFNSVGICVGYAVNCELLAEYEALNNTKITIGMVAAPFDNLVNTGKPINSDGTVSAVTSGRVMHYELEQVHAFIDMILTSSNWNKYADHKVILCAYIIENGKVGYICGDEITDVATYITYSEIIEKLA